MSEDTINTSGDVKVAITRVSERQKNDRKEIETLNDAIFGNGKDGIKNDVATIMRDIQEINEKFDDAEEKRKENEMSKQWKIGLICAFAMVMLSDWLPNIISMFE